MDREKGEWRYSEPSWRLLQLCRLHIWKMDISVPWRTQWRKQVCYKEQVILVLTNEGLIYLGKFHSAPLQFSMVLLCRYVVHFHCTLLRCGIDVLPKGVPVSRNCYMDGCWRRPLSCMALCPLAWYAWTVCCIADEYRCIDTVDTETCDRRTKPQWGEVQHNEQCGSKVKVCRTAGDEVNLFQQFVCCFLFENIKELWISCKVDHSTNACIVIATFGVTVCYNCNICTICCITVTGRYIASVSVTLLVLSLNGLEYLVIELKDLQNQLK